MLHRAIKINVNYKIFRIHIEILLTLFNMGATLKYHVPNTLTLSVVPFLLHVNNIENVVVTAWTCSIFWRNRMDH